MSAQHDFAPYQDASPERVRALSPPPRSPPPQRIGIRSPRASLDQARGPNNIRNIGTKAVTSPRIGGSGAGAGAGRSYFDEPAGWGGAGASGARSPDVGPGTGWGDDAAVTESRGWSRREEVDMFETRLGLRMDYEACLAYLLLPPAGAVLLLVLEHKSDYVRYVAGWAGLVEKCLYMKRNKVLMCGESDRFHAWQSALMFSVVFIVHVIFSWSAFISYIMLVGDLGLIGYMTYRAYLDAELLDRFEVPFFGPLASSILDDE
ncbi:hypothetical protein EJ05DRAFT_483828 [Pseudovirgaria hyperparasitica]|uniref:Uncharacterized protein n=1 Tax=Pseudovirgaria hyperparasitica TaxID=470096 RepID=A0A6A6WJF6_9PEZI|nr:uncharacterized protein EJ05DRAFT_483828 [Pseudovirgaria hyperparasitica]KAF2761461.1 hypothetical protein EJ05DRAFT_483828 [Pseudovirgaria hyperparasitica]